jgi:hypothetical protein
MYPVVVPASAIQRFKYWDNIVKEGMLFQNELYTFINQFSPHKRLAAYEKGCELTHQQTRVCITVEESGYILWECLRK